MWSIAYPLLKKYGFKATVFLVPGRIKYRNKYYPNLEDVWVGKANMQEVLERDHSDQPFATWEEVKTMHESGAFDFESHTFDHSLVFTSPEIIDFVNPVILSRYHLFEFPRIRCGEKEDQAQNLIRLGTPLYTTSSRMSDSLRYIDDSRFRRECIRYVEENGGEEFFKEEQWRRKLFRIMKNFGKNGSRGRYETKEEQIKAITFELDKSRKLIEEHLPGKAVRHLAYPWGGRKYFVSEDIHRDWLYN